MNNDREEEWLTVIGKSLAILAMHRSELGNSDLIERAIFLEGLGIPRQQVAAMLGSSTESLSVMFRRKMKGAKGRGGKKVRRK